MAAPRRPPGRRGPLLYTQDSADVGSAAAGSPIRPHRPHIAVDEAGRIPTDLGRKDTVTVWPGETVRVATNFSHDHVGEQAYLFHCHVLEHEDQGMMLNFKVVSAEN